MLQRIIRLSIWNMFEFTMKQREIKERNGDVEWEGGKGRGQSRGPFLVTRSNGQLGRSLPTFESGEYVFTLNPINGNNRLCCPQWEHTHGHGGTSRGKGQVVRWMREF